MFLCGTTVPHGMSWQCRDDTIRMWLSDPRPSSIWTPNIWSLENSQAIHKDISLICIKVHLNKSFQGFWQKHMPANNDSSVSEHLTSWKQRLSEFYFASSMQLLVLFILSKIPDGGTLSTPKPGSIALTSTFFISWLTSLLEFAFWTSSSGIKSQNQAEGERRIHQTSQVWTCWHADKSLEEGQKMQKQVGQDTNATTCREVSSHDSPQADAILKRQTPFCKDFPG